MNSLIDFFEKIFRFNFILRIGNRKARIFLFCHGLPERSPTIFGYKSPLCYRCIGLILGIIPALFIQLPFPNSLLFLCSIILIIPILIDGLTQNLGLRISNNNLRFGTGLLGGLGLFTFLNILINIQKVHTLTVMVILLLDH